jgi:hypothetical protein
VLRVRLWYRLNQQLLREFRYETPKENTVSAVFCPWSKAWLQRKTHRWSLASRYSVDAFIETTLEKKSVQQTSKIHPQTPAFAAKVCPWIDANDFHRWQKKACGWLSARALGQTSSALSGWNAASVDSDAEVCEQQWSKKTQSRR